jgi:hypothetical protein
METVREATIESFNQFVTQQRSLPGEANLFLAQFNTEYQVLFDKPIANAPMLSYLTYQPNGSTALYDAMGLTIDSLGQRLSAMPESDRPNKVICVILTDGLENSSRRYSQQMVAERVEHQRMKYCWEFVFLGANQDAVLTARGFNIPMEAAMSFCPAPGEIQSTAFAASRYVGERRAGRHAAFLDSERAAAMGQGTGAQSDDEEDKNTTALPPRSLSRKLKGFVRFARHE